MATELGRNAGKLRSSGVRFLVLGIVLAAVSVALILPGAGVVDVIGVTVAVLASLAIVAGVGLLIAGLVAGRMDRGKPFA